MDCSEIWLVSRLDSQEHPPPYWIIGIIWQFLGRLHCALLGSKWFFRCVFGWLAFVWDMHTLPQVHGDSIPCVSLWCFCTCVCVCMVSSLSLSSLFVSLRFQCSCHWIIKKPLILKLGPSPPLSCPPSICLFRTRLKSKPFHCVVFSLSVVHNCFSFQDGYLQFYIASYLCLQFT